LQKNIRTILKRLDAHTHLKVPIKTLPNRGSDAGERF
jgi:hypothetical protein